MAIDEKDKYSVGKSEGNQEKQFNFAFKVCFYSFILTCLVLRLTCQRQASSIFSNRSKHFKINLKFTDVTDFGYKNQIKFQKDVTAFLDIELSFISPSFCRNSYCANKVTM